MAIADCMLELAMLRPLRIYIRKPVRCSLLPYEKPLPAAAILLAGVTVFIDTSTTDASYKTQPCKQ